MSADGRAFVVTEPAGTPIALSGGWQGIAEMLGHALNAAGALSAAHEMGVFHGDLTLESLTLDARGEVRIARLGFLALFGVELHATHRLQAPEVLKRGYPTGPQADVYGLAAIIDRVVQDRVPAGGVVPAPLAELIAKGTAEHHEKRYGDMLELFDRLRDASTEVLAALPLVRCDRDTVPIEVDDGPKTHRGRESRETLPASIEIRAVRAGAMQPPPVHEPAAPPPPRGTTGPLAVVALGLAAAALGTAASLAVLLRPSPVVVQVPAPAAAPPPPVTAPPTPAAPAPVATSTPPAASRAPPPRRGALERLCESEEWYSCTMRRPSRR